MKKYVVTALSATLIVGGSAYAETYTPDVVISQLSLTGSGNGMLVQTTPRHTLDVGCSSDYWLVLQKSSPNYDILVSMLLTAQSRGSKVHVFAAGAGGEFCDLTRLVLEE